MLAAQRYKPEGPEFESRRPHKVRQRSNSVTLPSDPAPNNTPIIIKIIKKKNKTIRSGETAQRLREHTLFLQRTRAQFPAPRGGSQVEPLQGSRALSLEPRRQGDERFNAILSCTVSPGSRGYYRKTLTKTHNKSKPPPRTAPTNKSGI